MDKKSARKAVLPVFNLTRTCDQNELNSRMQTIPIAKTGASQIYYIRPAGIERADGNVPSPEWEPYKFNLFPVVIGKDGAPWDVATLYILSRMKDQGTPDTSTFHGLADDLGAFLAFLEEYGIDYLDFPEHKLKRPTYRFSGHLKNLVFEGKIAASTARRRMGSVIALYRWLVAENILSPAYPPWQEKDHYLSFKGRRGDAIRMAVKSTDIAIRTPEQHDPFEMTIVDGGKLRPLPLDEQKWLIEALAHLANPEMTLIHVFILITGARIQTALTLRVRHAQLQLSDEQSEVRLPIGPGMGVDTKNDKRMTLHIPRWFYDRLRIYSMSDRSRKRRERTSVGDTTDNYLFLTQQGCPYYQSKRDSMSFDPSNTVRHQKRAQTVRAFISRYVIPYIQKQHASDFHYRIHDLRATFGMNLTDTQLNLVERHETTLVRARDFVRARMGHESSVTTDAYLDFRRNLHIVHAAVDAHEMYFRELIERAWEGNLDDA